MLGVWDEIRLLLLAMVFGMFKGASRGPKACACEQIGMRLTGVLVSGAAFHVTTFNTRRSCKNATPKLKYPDVIQVGLR